MENDTKQALTLVPQGDILEHLKGAIIELENTKRELVQAQQRVDLFQDSPETGEIMKALAIAQEKFSVVNQDKKVDFQKKDSQGRVQYAFSSLPEALIVTRPALVENGIAWTVGVMDRNDRRYLLSRLVHGPSNQWLSSYLEVPLVSDPKQLKNIFTYYKRFLYFLQVGIAEKEQENGKPQTEWHPEQEQEPQPKPKKKDPLISQKGIAHLMVCAKKCHWTEDHVKQFIKHKWELDSRKKMTESNKTDLIAFMTRKPGPTKEEDESSPPPSVES